jgi:hypothetical protein
VRINALKISNEYNRMFLNAVLISQTETNVFTLKIFTGNNG